MNPFEREPFPFQLNPTFPDEVYVGYTCKPFINGGVAMDDEGLLLDSVDYNPLQFFTGGSPICLSAVSFKRPRYFETNDEQQFSTWFTPCVPPLSLYNYQLKPHPTVLNLLRQGNSALLLNAGHPQRGMCLSKIYLMHHPQLIVNVERVLPDAYSETLKYMRTHTSSSVFRNL